MVFVSSTFCLSQVFVSLHKTESTTTTVQGSLSGSSSRNISNLFTLNVRGQYITHRSCLGESKNSRFKNKKQTLKCFRSPAAASRSEVVTAWCCTSDPCQRHCGDAEQGGIGPEDCSAGVRDWYSDPFRLTRWWRWNRFR